ncbi:MAG: segregation/condensation protein A [Acidobacteriota bacterium]|nr:segregation/condensation protein A [Acidobacteriota bacterium]
MKTQRTHHGKLPDSWRVELPVFEGPLDLLLQLVKVNEVEITEIPVLLVCDQFHEYLALMEELDLDIAGEYIYEAALLIQIKSRLLLPRTPKEGEGDPRADLIRRLIEYEQLKEAANTFAETDNVRSGMWARRARAPNLVDQDERELDLEEVSLYDLLVAFRGALDRYQRENPEPLHLSGESYRIRDQIERILGRSERGRPLDILDDLLGLSCRAEAVAAFLALLELSRMELIRLHQTREGGILLYRTARPADREDIEAIQG